MQQNNVDIPFSLYFPSLPELVWGLNSEVLFLPLVSHGPHYVSHLQTQHLRQPLLASLYHPHLELCLLVNIRPRCHDDDDSICHQLSPLLRIWFPSRWWLVTCGRWCHSPLSSVLASREWTESQPLVDFLSPGGLSAGWQVAGKETRQFTDKTVNQQNWWQSTNITEDSSPTTLILYLRGSFKKFPDWADNSKSWHLFLLIFQLHVFQVNSEKK